jgi:hypothetical protein
LSSLRPSVRLGRSSHPDAFENNQDILGLMVCRGDLLAGSWEPEAGHLFGRARNRLFNASSVSVIPLLPAASLEMILFGRDGIEDVASDVHMRRRLSMAALLESCRELPDDLQPVVGYYECRWKQDRMSFECVLRVLPGSKIQEMAPSLALRFAGTDGPLPHWVPSNADKLLGDYGFGALLPSCSAIDDGGRWCHFILDPQQQLLYFCWGRDGY